MEILDIVNENDEVIWQIERTECYKKWTINRLVWVVIVNDKWEIALQKRSSKCSFLAWYWALSAWWHVSCWDTYLQAAKRELFEEIWIKCDLKFIWKDFDDRLKINWKLNDSDKSHYFFQEIYEWKHNWPFEFTDWEVNEIRFFSREELKEMIKSWYKIMPWTIRVLEKYYL